MGRIRMATWMLSMAIAQHRAGHGPTARQWPRSRDVIRGAEVWGKFGLLSDGGDDDDDDVVVVPTLLA